MREDFVVNVNLALFRFMSKARQLVKIPCMFCSICCLTVPRDFFVARRGVVPSGEA
jgi:hypothetical protein